MKQFKMKLTLVDRVHRVHNLVMFVSSSSVSVSIGMGIDMLNVHTCGL